MLKLWYSPSYLATWLNEPGHQKATTRFVDVIESTKQLAARAATRKQIGSREQRRTAELEGHINELLSHGRPAHLRLHGLNVWRFSGGKVTPPAPGSVHYRWMPADMSDTEGDVWNATEAVRKLSEQGNLGRIRRCQLESCRAWFYAASSLKTFCSDSCHQKEKRSSPKFQEGRAVYQLNYYYRHQRKRENMTDAELREFIRRSEWKFAKTMPSTPHEYTLRRSSRDEPLFKRVVVHIRQAGYQQKFKGALYIYLDVTVDGIVYSLWTMGSSVNATILMNRVRKSESCSSILKKEGDQL